MTADVSDHLALQAAVAVALAELIESGEVTRCATCRRTFITENAGLHRLTFHLSD